MSTEESSAESADSPVDAAPKLRLSDVERALGPLRRTVAFAAREPDSVRYVESTCTQWVERALALPLPASVALDLAEIGRQLSGLDALEGEERLTRIGDVNALIVRVDAMLGLPLDRLRFRRARKKVYPRRQEELPAEAPEPAESPEQETAGLSFAAAEHVDPAQGTVSD